MKRKAGIMFAAIALILCFTTTTVARVKSITINSAADYTSTGYSGAYGPYEWVIGKVTYEIDPEDPLNAVIVDIDKAPRNVDGLVEFSTDFQLLKPKNIELGSKKLLYIVVNRGNRSKNFNDLLANRGFTIVWSGWQGNIPFGLTAPNAGTFGNDFPIARNPDDSSITGKVYNTFYVAANNVAAAVPYSLLLTFDRNAGYKAVPAFYANHLDDPNAELWTHEYPYEPRVPVDKSLWAFAQANPDGSIGAPSENHIWLEGGFQPGLGYELVYTGKDPIVNGLSFASVRDLMSFLKYDTSSANPVAVPGGMIAAYAYGKSQSGRFLRVLTYLGFNESEDYRQVFEGIYADAPGGSQGAFNFRFCNPGRVTAPDVDIYQLTDYPPFSFSTTTDPYTGFTGSLLDRAIERNVVPKFFQIQTSAEYWRRSGSLAHLLPDLSGDQDFPPEYVRYYHISSTQHSPNTNSTTNPLRQLPSNTNNFKPVIDGLLIALDEWVTKGVKPPNNSLPKIEDKTIGDWRQEASGFPSIPGVNYPSYIHEPPIFDPQTLVDGVVTELPMQTLPPHFYPAYAPTVDADGNEIAGIITPDVHCAVATYTGWTWPRKF